MYLVWCLTCPASQRTPIFLYAREKSFGSPLQSQKKQTLLYKTFLFPPIVVSIKATLLLHDKFTTSNDVLKL